jgi:hypothetical protein
VGSWATPRAARRGREAGASGAHAGVLTFAGAGDFAAIFLAAGLAI